jgi:hypothetical protein
LPTALCRQHNTKLRTCQGQSGCRVARFQRLAGYRVELIDVLADAKRAVTDNVIVTPTLVAIGSKRQLIMVGDLSDSNKLQGLLKSAANFS